MRYTPGGYSWLSVAPETDEEKTMDHLEQKIHALKKEYEKAPVPEILSQIEYLEKQLRESEEKKLQA